MYTTTLVNVLHLLISNELKQVTIVTRNLNVFAIMSDPLAERYFNIIKKQIKDEQTYLEAIRSKHDKRRSSKHLVR